jgi:hypothetical protein
MDMIELLISLGAGVAGYVTTKDFTKRKLRFVDAVHAAPVPVIAGVGAALIAAPVVWLLPIVGAPAAILLGAGVGLGVRSAQKERHLIE